MCCKSRLILILKIACQVFAPSNSAWDNLSEDVQVALYGSLGSVVSNSLLQYHIVPDVAITSSQILGSESQTVTAMSGFSLRIFDLNGTLKVNGLPVSDILSLTLFDSS